MNKKQQEKKLVTLKAFLSNDLETDFLVKKCILVPDDDSWRTWYDQLGNQLSIRDNKKWKIKYKSTQPNVVDLYLKANLNYLLSNSLKVLEENNISEKYYYILGQDQIFRIKKISYDQFETIMPLELGPEKLKKIINKFI